jgi:hypothetical protein
MRAFFTTDSDLSVKIVSLESSFAEMSVKFETLERMVSELAVTVKEMKVLHSEVIVKVTEKTYQDEAEFACKIKAVEAKLAAVASELADCGQNRNADHLAPVSSGAGPSRLSNGDFPPLSGSEQSPWKVAESKKKKKRQQKITAPSTSWSDVAARTGVSEIPKPLLASGVSGAPIKPELTTVSEFETPTRKRRAVITRSANGGPLVIGDSIVRHTADLSKRVGVSTICVPGGTVKDIMEVVSALPRLFSAPPSKVIFHVGTNNWANWESAKGVAHRLRELLVLSRSLLPEAKILVSGLLLRRDSRDQDIKEVNKEISNVMRTFPNTFFIDCNVRCKTQFWLGKDGLHLNRLGSRLLSDVFVNPFPKNW